MTGYRFNAARRLAVTDTTEVVIGSIHGIGGMERLVAAKRLRPEVADQPELMEALVHEARIAAKLAHPGAVGVLDVIHGPTGLTLLMEYVPGEDLRYLLGAARDRGVGVPGPLACRIVASVASTLEAAYPRIAATAGGAVVHGALTPGNVLVAYSGAVKVSGFRGRAPDRATLGRTGFAYGSPELALGDPLDERSDVFSLGVLLHELLTGRRLFAGESIDELTQALLTAPIPPPSGAADDVSPEVDAIVGRMLTRSPDLRTAHMAHVRDELEGALKGLGGMPSQSALVEWLGATFRDRKALRRDRERLVLRETRDGGAPRGATLPGLFEDLTPESRDAVPDEVVSEAPAWAETPVEVMTSLDAVADADGPRPPPATSPWVYAALGSTLVLLLSALAVALYLFAEEV